MLRRGIIRERPPANGNSFPAPTGGWNVADPLDNMDQADAVALDNVFPGTSAVSVRNGFTTFCTGLAGPVETLVDFQSGTAGKLLAAAGGSIYEISTGTATSLGSGYTSNRWQSVNFATTGGRFAVMVNGSDAPLNYNGTALSTSPAITGVTPSTLVYVEWFKGRLYFVQKDTLNIWFLPTLQIGGAATQYDMSALFPLGGSIQSIGTWTRDNGAGGADDLFVVVSTEGEVLLFSGSDPGSATDWALIGRFIIGRPVGRRCLVKYGPELVVIGQDGIQPLSSRLTVDTAQAVETEISQKIGSAITDAIAATGDVFGWEGCVYPKGTRIIFNVPQTASAATQQYVVNTITGAWCRFTGMDAATWSTFNGNLYFGSRTAGTVFRADTGFSDNGAAIPWNLQTAYTYPGGRGLLKRFTMVRPIFASNGIPAPQVGIGVDFDPVVPVADIVSNGSGYLWDVATWDASLWGADTQLFRDWVTVNGTGYSVSLRMTGSSSTVGFRFTSFDILFERGAFV